MLQVEILLFNREGNKRIRITDLAASAFHRVISSETDKMTHLTSLRSCRLQEFDEGRNSQVQKEHL